MVHGESLSLAPERTFALGDQVYGSLEEYLQLTAQLRDVLGARFVQIAPPDTQ